MTARRMKRTRDSYYMRLALDLALRGTGKTAPNPKVGCVIVKDDRITGWGYHKACGLAHAEVVALDVAGEQARGATLYVNLEPCSHYGKTPPCTEAIIKAGVARVVAAMQDPDPRVSGKGFARLRDAGLEVDIGTCRTEAMEINRGFVTRVQKNRPWVTLKAAMTMDGCIAQEDGWSKWISNKWSRTRAHLLRASHDALLVGVGTVVADDPKLNVREVSGSAPRVVILDPSLRTPPDASLFCCGSPLVIASKGADSRRARELENAGADVILLSSEEGRPSLVEVLQLLAGQGVNDLLVEGGAGVLGSFLKEGLFDGVSLFISPRFLGKGRPVSGGFLNGTLEKARRIRIQKTLLVEGDLWIEGTSACSLDS